MQQCHLPDGLITANVLRFSAKRDLSKWLLQNPSLPSGLLPLLLQIYTKLPLQDAHSPLSADLYESFVAFGTLPILAKSQAWLKPIEPLEKPEASSLDSRRFRYEFRYHLDARTSANRAAARILHTELDYAYDDADVSSLPDVLRKLEQFLEHVTDGMVCVSLSPGKLRST